LDCILQSISCPSGGEACERLHGEDCGKSFDIREAKYFARKEGASAARFFVLDKLSQGAGFYLKPPADAPGKSTWFKPILLRRPPHSANRARFFQAVAVGDDRGFSKSNETALRFLLVRVLALHVSGSMQI
jgi:hypothetical protein